jgi:poly(A) polymerase
MSTATARLDSARHPWMRDDGLRRLMKTIKKGGGELRFVGGCVRDALLGLPVGEIDLASSLPPERVSELLAKAGFKVVPTGIAHGTVTAVVDHKGHEITTLRRDVETDGRRAKVAFTDDWQADAARRDFTFNALYADADGKVYDYFDGRADLENRHVRFIGDAQERIREDVLRILRFFRFYAWFGRGEPDGEGLAACRELAHLIPQLSIERVWREVSKLLNAANPLPAWKLMKENGVLAQVLPEADNLNRLATLLEAEKHYGIASSHLLRLAALLPRDGALATEIGLRLKLSNLEAEKLQLLAELPDRMKGSLGALSVRRFLYDHGPLSLRDAILLRKADAPEADIEAALAATAVWEKPVFPLQGSDMLKLGLAPGPEIGEILRAVEAWWIERDFRPGREECLAEAKNLKSRMGLSKGHEAPS